MGYGYLYGPYGRLFLDERLRENLRLSGFSSGGERERLPRDLAAAQNARLAETLRRCARTAHYREVLPRAAALADRLERGAGQGEPAPLRRALRELPITRPEQLAAAPERFLALSHSEVEGVISLPSSGTSGLAKRVFSTAEDQAESGDFFAWGIRFLARPNGPEPGGERAGERVAMLMSGERPGSVGAIFSAALERSGIDCRVLGLPVSAEASIAALAEYRPTCLVSLPGHALALARHPLAGQIPDSLHSVLLSGDMISPGLSAVVGQALGARVFTHYGLTETGLAGAVECPARSGCHPREEALFFEIVDAAGQSFDPLHCPGRITPWGEVCVTTLSRRAMPLLRYRTGDLGRLEAGRCRCGSMLQRLQLRGRLADVAPLRRRPGEKRPALPLYAIDDRLCHLPFVRGLDISVSYADAECSLPRRLELAVDLTADAPAKAGQAVEKALDPLLRACFDPGEAVRLELELRPFAPGADIFRGKRSIRHIPADLSGTAGSAESGD